MHYMYFVTTEGSITYYSKAVTLQLEGIFHLKFNLILCSVDEKDTLERFWLLAPSHTDYLWSTFPVTLPPGRLFPRYRGTCL